MFQAFLSKLQNSILGGAIILGAASVVSRLMGLVRDRLLATSFGAGDVLDTYYAAFRLPDFLFNILVLGALSSSFIPVFLEYWYRRDGSGQAEAWRMTNSVLNLLMLGLVGLAALILIFANPLMQVIVPGFSPEKQAETASLTRIVLLSVIFFGVSNVLSGILNSFRRFLAFSLAPILYNVGIIIGIYAFVPRWGAAGLAWGVVIGAALHALVQLPSVWRTGFRHQWRIDWHHPGVRKIWRLMIPRTLGLAVVQINQTVMNVIASTLRSGSVSVFNFANNLQSFPINVFGVSLAISAFPVFSRAFAEQDTAGFVKHFSETFRRVLFFIIPVSVAVVLLRAQIVRLVLGAGQFNWTDTVLTAQTLGVFSLSLFAQSLIPLLARSFYAFHNTRTPVIISIVSMAINVGLGIVLSREQGIIGLVLAFSLASVVNMLALLAALRVQVGDLDDRKLTISTIKILVASAGLGLIIQRLKYFIAPLVDMHTFWGVAIQTGTSLLVGAVVYIIIALVLQSEEIEMIRRQLIRAKKFFIRSASTS